MRKLTTCVRAFARNAMMLIASSGAFMTAALAEPDLAALKALYVRPETIPFPEDNPYTPEKAALGKMLYFDQRLSRDNNISCASCHNPSFGWEVPVSTPTGAQGTPLDRHAPTVLNMAWGDGVYFWDGRATTLEEQAKGPLEADVEMNLPLPRLVARLKAIPDYVRWFEHVFPEDGVTPDTIARAIATYERTIVSGYAPFDAWIDGDEDAISEAAKRGFVLFNGKARCADCHTGWNMTDNLFHDIGLVTFDRGRGLLEPDNPHAQFAFKTPGLRDVTQRAPFMHNGSIANLDRLIVHYVSGGIDRPSRSPLMRALDLTNEEREDLKAFLETLTGETVSVPLPILPN